jgi:hypothetical protein
VEGGCDEEEEEARAHLVLPWFQRCRPREFDREQAWRKNGEPCGEEECSLALTSGRNRKRTGSRILSVSPDALVEVIDDILRAPDGVHEVFLRMRREVSEERKRKRGENKPAPYALRARI